VNSFDPILAVLKAPQLELWTKLCEVPETFVLYGGTALALRLGHRYSIDYDFFSADEFDSDKLLSRIPFMENVVDVLQNKQNTLEVVLDGINGPTKISFFGNVNFGYIDVPSKVVENNITVASVRDIFAWKLKTICSRIEVKDFQDIAEMIRRGFRLEDGINCVVSLFKGLINTSHPIKALDYLDIPPLEELSEDDKILLRNAAQSFEFKNVAPVPIYNY
tara:strand:- start:473 stop:1132 length:660 start_codon:yes stop_codon:yes gene_type:complete